MNRITFGLFICFVWGCFYVTTACSSNKEIIDVPLTNEDEAEFIIAFGDIQCYTMNDANIEYYKSSIEWINDHKKQGMKINCILQYGDVTETNAEEEWERFYSSTKDIASIIPFYACVGNHDYDRTPGKYILGRNTTRINDYANFPLTRSSIVAYYETDRLENYVAKVSILGKAVYLLVLEFAVRTEILQWAKAYVESHSDCLFVLMTHEWLSDNIIRVSNDSYAYWQIGSGSTFSTAEQVWESLVWPNNNIVCVLCGHNVLTGQLLSKNQAGREVPQIMLNTQKLENGGNGIIQIWEFSHKSDLVKICAYDSINNVWFKPEYTSITFPFFLNEI